MSKERELLKQVVENFAYDQDMHLIVAIQKLLNQPEQSSTTRHALDSYWNQEAYQRGYAQAELDLKREPLSEDKLDVLAEANITDEGIAGYYLGFRDAEKAHGITGVDDE